MWNGRVRRRPRADQRPGGDGSPGFVWRLQTEDGDATALRVFDDHMIIVNMSAWASVEEAKAKLEMLRERGPTAEAFILRDPVPAPSSSGA